MFEDFEILYLFVYLFFIIFFIIIKITVKSYYWTPKMGKNSILSPFFPKGKKSLGQNPLLEPKFSLRIGPFLLVKCLGCSTCAKRNIRVWWPGLGPEPIRASSSVAKFRANIGRSTECQDFPTAPVFFNWTFTAYFGWTLHCSQLQSQLHVEELLS